MTLPTTPGSSLSMNQVNVELGFGESTAISLQDTAVRSLFEKTTVSSEISFSDGSNKTNIKLTGISPYSAFANSHLQFGAHCSSTGYSSFNFHANGQIDATEGAFGGDPFNRWGVDGITGGNFYIRFTRTLLSGSLATATASTGWLQLNTSRQVGVSSSFAGVAGYTIEIAGGSGGTPLLLTRTDVQFEIFDECQGG